ncbi:Integral membrane protein [Lasiodiplodia theobromae]|uniref:Integral membrane protein n=1 Tax=Lasiodiplodia theobromae TaxID=45133 RepID=UPI0015C364EA|nr:Integral membrane protein [Lasiodiplodia theobromae]KAF4540601.1 Integral membrane protein [Lasiodiplodia theobromae]
MLVTMLTAASKQYCFAEFSYVVSMLFIKLSLTYFYPPLTNLPRQIYTVYTISLLYKTGYLYAHNTAEFISDLILSALPI